MKIKRKSCFAILLALVLMFALSVPVCAADSSDEGKDLVIEVVQDDPEADAADVVTVEDEDIPLGSTPDAAESHAASAYIFLLIAVVVVLAAGITAIRIEQTRIDSLTAELNRLCVSEAGE